MKIQTFLKPDQGHKRIEALQMYGKWETKQEEESE